MSSALPIAPDGLSAPGDALPSGGFRQCLLHPGRLLRWFTSRRFRHAVEVRKHVWKIRSFQKDDLTPAALAGIDAGLRRFDAMLWSKPTAANIAAGLQDLEVTAQKWLKPYANAAFRENVEVFLVAIAVAMAIRTFFLQPFKIPTGSMQPTLYGTHYQDLRAEPASVMPGFFGRVASAIFLGRYYHEVIAEADGQVLGLEPRRSILFVGYQDLHLRYTDGGRTWDDKRRIWFAPLDGHGGDLRRLQSVVGIQPMQYEPFYPGQTFKKGDVLLRLLDSSGDHLFVDRVTYNFRPPHRGEIVVFETKGIRGLAQDQFYIKRLVAMPGERVRIGDDRHLVINDQRLDQTAPHFEKVYSFEGPPQDSRYSGHVNGTVAARAQRPGLARLFPQESAEFRVGPRSYMVMGDNTLNSLDSRDWGDFPQTNVVGRYCFVWWPFTSRWGTRPN